MIREFDYFRARVCINEEYENGDVDAKIFPNKHDIEFVGSRFSREAFRKILDEIREGKLKLR